MIERIIFKDLIDDIDLTPAVVLLGARQVGKTTLAKALSARMPSIYLDLESPKDIASLTDPEQFLQEHADRLIILDEIHRAPDLFRVLRGVIDSNRQLGKEGKQFLLLGSASMNLQRQSSESLAGRISYLEMAGFNILETGPENTRQLWLCGTFPNNYLANNESVAMRRIENLIRAYLERDIPQMGFAVPATRLRQLWTMLAHCQGETINFSKFANNLEVDSKTVKFYTDILVDLLLIRRVQPWHANIKKRLVKSSRYYVRDSGILHRLLGIGNYSELLTHPILGKSWEGFVVENIHSVLPHLAETYFYRTAAGAEIDLVIKMPNHQVWGIEIKYGLAPKLDKHFKQTFNDAGVTHKYIVYGGEDEYPVGDDVRMISLPKLMQKLIAETSQSPSANYSPCRENRVGAKESSAN